MRTAGCSGFTALGSEKSVRLKLNYERHFTLAHTHTHRYSHAQTGRQKHRQTEELGSLFDMSYGLVVYKQHVGQVEGGP